MVVIDPIGGWVHAAKRWFPGLFDRALSLGRCRRVADKTRELDELSPDRDTALRMKLGLGPTGAETRAAA
jgi:hypothetical protein